jgi:hypothetical protein
MKVVCPECHKIGILEQRGNSQRVVHYRYVDSKRVFERHTVTGFLNPEDERAGNNGNG